MADARDAGLSGPAVLREFSMTFPADLRRTKNLSAIAHNIEGIINVALRENLSCHGFPPPSINLWLEGRGDLIELRVSAKPFQFNHQLEE